VKEDCSGVGGGGAVTSPEPSASPGCSLLLLPMSPPSGTTTDSTITKPSVLRWSPDGSSRPPVPGEEGNSRLTMGRFPPSSWWPFSEGGSAGSTTLLPMLDARASCSERLASIEE